MEKPYEEMTSTGGVIYRYYVLFLFVLAYLLNQLDRYLLSVVTQFMAHDLHYGSKGCLTNTSFSEEQIGNYKCTNETDETVCLTVTTSTDLHVCYWDYTGQGLDFEILVGPVFIVIYTLAGIPIGFWADVYNRKILLGASIIFWSVMTILTGLVKEYWSLALLRFLLGIGEAGCTPFATSLITDYFGPEFRALAIGIYNWGIYIGYSFSYLVGSYVTHANILNQGWSWCYYLSGLPGLLLGPLILFSVKEPRRPIRATNSDTSDSTTLLARHFEPETCVKKLKIIGSVFCRPSVLLLCLAGSVRNAAGYVWSYNTQIYYAGLGQSAEDIAAYMSWIPIVGGCLGVVAGGFISDRVVKRVGPRARLAVLVISQAIAVPFVAGALYLYPPWCYICLIPGYLFGEMWVGITLAVLVELIPSPVRTMGIAVYLFIISNIGGNMPLLVPPIKNAFMGIGLNSEKSLAAALYILYPGLYVLGAILFLVTMFVLKWDMNRARRTEYEDIS